CGSWISPRSDLPVRPRRETLPDRWVVLLCSADPDRDVLDALRGGAALQGEGRGGTGDGPPAPDTHTVDGHEELGPVTRLRDVRDLDVAHRVVVGLQSPGDLDTRSEERRVGQEE